MSVLDGAIAEAARLNFLRSVGCGDCQLLPSLYTDGTWSGGVLVAAGNPPVAAAVVSAPLVLRWTGWTEYELKQRLGLA